MNNEQIDNTDYYRLPCGKYLEDFIWWKKLDFATGSALKYAWRAGKKFGESLEKEGAKMKHYIKFLAAHKYANDCAPYQTAESEISNLALLAECWDGKER